MVRKIGFIAAFLLAAAGASVVASHYVGLQETPASARPAVTSPVPAQPLAPEARWTTVPVRVARIEGHVRIPAVAAPRDINVGVSSAEPRIPTPPARPPSTEWLLENDRAYLAGWCRSQRDARRLCQQMRRPAPAQSAGRVRERRSRVTVRIARSDRNRAVVRRDPNLRQASAAFERSPNYDLLR